MDATYSNTLPEGAQSLNGGPPPGSIIAAPMFESSSTRMINFWKERPLYIIAALLLVAGIVMMILWPNWSNK